MAYFRYVPDLLYKSLQQSGSSFDTARVKNLFRRGKIREDIFNTVIYFDKYSIKGDDRPDNVAFEIYGNSEYDWVVLLSNNIINIRDEWPLDDISFEKYISAKYTDEQRFEVHHYETEEIKDSENRLIRESGMIVSVDSYDDYSFSYFNGVEIVTETNTSLLPITNYAYEVDLNEKKRSIFLLKPQFLTTVTQDLKGIMKYSESSQFVDKNTKKTIN
ncbi:baseplate wedge subunit [Synechococcus phage DSL-LC02]|nr:baseplate wedge subunit [Synechococcus phage DSL-LC02]